MWFFQIVLTLGLMAGVFNRVTSDDPELIASTKLGQIKGSVITTRLGRKILGFRGIPYAAPPVGPLRFKAPQKHPGFKGVLDATKDGDDCMQPGVFYNSYKTSINAKKAVGSEDCLFLNVYTPKVKPSSLYPVMVFIHGGAFAIGTGSSVFFGPELLLDKDVLLVTMNYRLGILGFLSTEDGVVSGNMGLRDQILALKWIKDNIQDFGGDPNKITLFGQCNGGSSVHFHTLSPHSKDLFQQAISQSGTANALWMFQKPGQPKRLNEKVAKYLKCPVESKPFVDCLMSKSGYDLINATVSLGNPLTSIFFTPNFEPESPDALITKDILKQESSIPFVFGVNSAEGIIMEGIYSSLISKSEPEAFKQLTEYVFLSQAKNSDELFNKIIKFYLGENGKITDAKNHDLLNEMIRDVLFTVPLKQACKNHKGPTYLYYLTHRPQRSIINIAGLGNKVKGVSHGDDLSFLLADKKLIPSNLKFNKEDAILVDAMLEYWTNFATYGNPSGKKNGSLQNWEESAGCTKYIELTPTLKMKENLMKDKIDFLLPLQDNIQWLEA